MGVFTPAKKFDAKDVQPAMMPSLQTSTSPVTTTSIVTTSPSSPVYSSSATATTASAAIHQRPPNDTFRQKKARKTMPSGKMRESDCIILSPIRDEQVSSVGKVRKRASMGGSSGAYQDMFPCRFVCLSWCKEMQTTVPSKSFSFS